MIKNIVERSSRLQVGVIGTAVGAITLTNVYSQMLGFTYLRHIFTILGLVIFVLGLIKISIHREVFFKEFNDNTILASLYGTFSMLAMLLGAYFYNFNTTLGVALWFFGVVFHAILILKFTYKKVIKGFELKTFAPSWFVTYNGIMVSIVIGGNIDAPFIKHTIMIYGICVYLFILPFMVMRIIKNPLPDGMFHTKAVLLAPVSLCLVSYLAVAKYINPNFVYFLYVILLIKIVVIFKDIPKFFSFPFTPGFAALTFPNAIAVVASVKMAGYLNKIGHPYLSEAVRNIAGIQIFVTTFIIAFVFYNFLKMAKKKTEKRKIK